MKSSPKSGEVTPLMSLHLPAALNASASSGAVQAADKMSSEPRHIWVERHSATAATTGWMKQEENVYLSLSLLLFYRTVSNWAWLYIVNVNAQ